MEDPSWHSAAAKPGSIQEEDCMQEDLDTGGDDSQHHWNVVLTRSHWPNLLNASLSPINRHLSRSDAGL